MKKITLITFLLFAAVLCGYSQDQLPPELEKMEERLVELKAQVVTLQTYSPKDFPDFKDLEVTNQLVELIEFNKRKFDLLIKQFNLFEDEIFPFLLNLSEENPRLRNAIVLKVREYGGKEEKSVLRIQENINRLALQIERLEKKIERVQAAEKDREITEEKKRKVAAGEKSLDIFARIQKAEEEHKIYLEKLKEEEKKSQELTRDEKKQEEKIAEKTAEIETSKQEAVKSRNSVKRQINLLLAKVKEIRINGLEIPRLNTAKTFIYLSETGKRTLKEQADNLAKEINSLKKIRKRELQNKGIKGILIIFIALLLVFVLNKIAKRISRKIRDRIEKSETVDSHHKQRYQTLSSVILSFIKILSWTLAVLWVLGELEIDYAPFLVAAGGISLAIGFGAQSLVKDVVTGFFILMEEQFALGDYVEIEGKSGTIEKISLRTVQFRSLDGTLHIVPNGSISSVSNATHQWSRAVIKIGVSYDADAGLVLSVLNDICRDIFNDPEWKPYLIEEPIAQGILSFGASAVDFRILAKTLPGQQWAVDREFNLRIKKSFDEKGIEIPYDTVSIVDHTQTKSSK